MKIRSLLLGSVAAAGLSTGAYAADLGVLTSLDVCDALGLSGLTISSDTNCLQITGSVAYEFSWGDYDVGSDVLVVTGAGDFSVPDDDGDFDWDSKVEAWIKFVATADSDFGPAKAVIKIKELQQTTGLGFDGAGTVTIGGDDTLGTSELGGVIFDEAYVSVGDSTVLMAGKKGTIMNLGDDVPLNFLGLFNSEDVDVGVKWNAEIPDGGHVIQVVSDLGNGVSVGAGLENLASLSTTTGGTLVGVLSYAGDGIAAHVTVAGAGWLDGVVENWGFHAGVSGSFDPIKFVGAVAGDNSGYWNALGSVAATFDMFTIAFSGEAVQNNATSGGGNGGLDVGVGGSISAGVTDGVTINVGGRWYRDAGDGNDGWQAAAQLVAAVTESITITGEIGVYDNTGGAATANIPMTFYGAAQLAWAPGGGFTSSIKGEAYSSGAYKATFKAAKTFE